MYSWQHTVYMYMYLIKIITRANNINFQINML